jgi:iron complex outermembrane receptor protein
MSTTTIAHSAAASALACCFIASRGAAAEATDDATAREPATFASLSLEELSQIKIITASKREQTVENVPAAVDVVTHGDIQRSGATSIPEALRNVPGLNVGV